MRHRIPDTAVKIEAEPLDGAEGYRVKMYDEEGNLVAHYYNRGETFRFMTSDRAGFLKIGTGNPFNIDVTSNDPLPNLYEPWRNNE